MALFRFSSSALWIPFCILCLSFSADAGEIKVKLFGSPCALKGPFDAGALQRIHEISPEQILVVDTDPTPERFNQIKSSFEKIQRVRSLPGSLDPYREKARRRLEAQWSFAREFQKWSPKTPVLANDPQLKKFITSLRPHVGAQEQVLIDVEKYLTLGQWSAAVEVYELAIEPDPEEYFHRAIGKLKVQYRCSHEPVQDPSPL